ncbi:Fibrillin-2 [Stylophora pistillata]|uniref:Fibrillin-2 n=1 Tax=Stylophora pistillata TaxID=50429 RepID=A0A2B4R3S1_STYPI|nr:Fibrillin-2 [Stylophora pistillata]
MRADDLISDIDECSQNSHNFSKITATSNNTKGSFKCSCKPGLSGDGHNCTDIDECAENIHNCSKDNATCSNSKGTFNCSCNPGFRGVEYNCTDIDECSENIHNCSNITATCSNTLGASKCVCKPGFIRDRHNCTVAYDFPTLLFIHENDQESVPLLPFQTETSVFKTTIVARTPTVQRPRDLTTTLAILDSAGMDINAKTSTSVLKTATTAAIKLPLVTIPRDHSSAFVNQDSVVMDTTAQVPYSEALSYQREKYIELAETKATSMTSMSVLTIPITAARAVSLVQTLRDHSIALAVLDSLEMDTPAKTVLDLPAWFISIMLHVDKFFKMAAKLGDCQKSDHIDILIDLSGQH